MAPLPEVVLYDSGKRRLARTTNEPAYPVHLDFLWHDLGVLLDTTRLLGAFEQNATRKESAEGLVITCELPKRLFPVANPLTTLGQPKLKTARLSVMLNRDGSLAGLMLRVTRTDPIAGFNRRARLEGLDANGITKTFSPADLEDDDTDGGTSQYELRVQSVPLRHALRNSSR
jgi:hypothetical protein